MAPRYDTDGMLPTRAIYPASRPLPYIALLVTSKALKAFGLYLLYDLLKLVHVVVLFFLVQMGSSLILVLLQKPFSSSKRLTGKQWAHVVRGAVMDSVTCLLWLFGLTLTGPLRATLLYEHSHVVVAAAGAALISGTGGPSKSRGAFFLLLAVVGILFFDHDYEGHRSQESITNAGGHAESPHDSFFTHLFYHLLSVSGLSDHKGGVVLLVCTLLLNTIHGAATRKLSVEVGGAKRLNALTSFVSFLIMAPWAAVMYFTTESVITSSFIHLVVPLLLTILLVFVIDYYIDGLAATRLDVPRAARIGTVAVFVSALFLSSLWNHPFVASLTTMTKYQELITEDHILSAGVVFSFILLLFATTSLTSPSAPTSGGGGGRGVLASAAGGAPLLLSYAEEALLHGSQSVLSMAKNGLRQILDDVNSRRIFYFLCINLAFTFVELLYGAWTNSLGLISDGFHMLFDCSALVMGLYASVMSRWKATRIFSFGYDRLEILSGFVNGLFLVVIAFFVFIAALERLHDPPSIDTERLLPVSVAGLCVNLIGICAFSHAHSHGGAHGHSHGGSHSHAGAACSSGGGSGGGSHGHGHSHGSGAGSSGSSSSCGHGHGQSEAGHGHSHDVAGHHGHAHAQEPCRGENGGHHGHSHGSPGGLPAKAEKKVHNTNMEGVYLHVLADTMSSVGVIVSTLLMEYFGWFIADPICSLFIATMIGLSVMPLLRETAAILLLCTPPDLLTTWQDVVRKILDVDGVLAVKEHHFWSHSSSVACGTVRVHVKANASEQAVLSQVSSVLKAAGLKNTAVQVEKDDYVQHVIGLTSSHPGPLKDAYLGVRLGEEIKNV